MVSRVIAAGIVVLGLIFITVEAFGASATLANQPDDFAVLAALALFFITPLLTIRAGMWFITRLFPKDRS